MELSVLISFAIAALLLSLLPGPDNILVVTESVTNGRKNGIALAAGFASGVIVHTLLAITGITLILQSSQAVFQMVLYCGVAYLFYLAYQTWREKKQVISSQPGFQIQGDTKLFRKAFLMNVLNPKVSLFFIALLPQFVQETGYHPSIQMMILGILFMGIAFVVFSSFAIVAGSFHRYLQRPDFWQYMKWVKVIVLCGLAIFLLVS